MHSCLLSRPRHLRFRSCRVVGPPGTGSNNRVTTALAVWLIVCSPTVGPGTLPCPLRVLLRMEILAAGPRSMLCRPCVDCGLVTGRYCDHCMAARRIPSEEWAPNQRTPLCSRCHIRGRCRFCRGIPSCTPFAHYGSPTTGSDASRLIETAVSSSDGPPVTRATPRNPP